MNNQYNFNLDFNPNNFLSSTDRDNLPNGFMGCERLHAEELNCLDDSNLDRCYQLELCKNKDLVKNMYDKRNDHFTADESYMNMVNIYNFSIFKTMNLSVGIIASMVFIYYHK
jgi:hypothetical protein